MPLFLRYTWSGPCSSSGIPVGAAVGGGIENKVITTVDNANQCDIMSKGGVKR
jgi:hypothetical protein